MGEQKSASQPIIIDSYDDINREPPDGSEPTPERQTELLAAYEKNIKNGRAPYADVVFRTLGEVLWVIREHNWSSEDARSEGQGRVNLSNASFIYINLQGANLSWANFNNATLLWVNLSDAHLDGANLNGAHIESSLLNDASLLWANLNGTSLEKVEVKQTDLREVHMDSATVLRSITFDSRTLLADVVWNNAPMTLINWAQVPILGDEHQARQPYKSKQKKENKSREERLSEYQAAVRAYRQLATALRGQGLNEEADRFAYRANLLQRVVWRRQRRPLKYLASWFFWLIAGYGYRPLHSVIAYLGIILGFMLLYLLNAHFVSPHLTWDQALVLSVSSFHGRGFFESDITLGSGYARLAAAEAVLGLLIEISFIATFTQRFFGK